MNSSKKFRKLLIFPTIALGIDSIVSIIKRLIKPIQ